MTEDSLKQIRAKDAAYLFGGIIIGSVMGTFGAVFYQWIYDSEKNKVMFLPFVGLAGSFYFGFLILMLIVFFKKLPEAKSNEKDESSELLRQILAELKEQKMTKNESENGKTTKPKPSDNKT